MHPSTIDDAALIDVEAPNHDHESSPTRFHEPSPLASVPLLLRPSYARSRVPISDDLRHLRISLKWCALDQSSCFGKFISIFTFILFTVVIPIVSSLAVKVPPTAPVENPISFNLLVQFPESGLAAIGFFTLCRFFNKYGLRQLLFLDALEHDSALVRRNYARERDKSFRYLSYILLPSFLVELAHKVVFFSTVSVSFSLPFPFPSNAILFVLVLASWIYRTGIFLLVCVLFRLTCELQILRLGGLHGMLEGCGSNPSAIFDEHVRIRKQLSTTSHRYRFFIISCLVTMTVSQFAALLIVLASKTEKNFFNSGDLVVCTVVELSGLFLCLVGAARITHRAQGIASVATRWHMLVTSASGLNRPKPETAEHDSSHSDTDSDLVIPVSTSSDSGSFQIRQALVAYLERNNGGITLYGFPLDRGLLHTIFAFEFSLVLWILSKVVVLS
ncbi:uncharacterized protein LOC115753399 isoform X1 [Rhodamnia argentea]|uniref:Uncharacterized protein LOC115753399 isoform X1 n=1 Tax=Rhodamnia argentea TaxID=178133 RepID=A0ABM3GW91_9MYRT|nr:uncharacterized protein LOC115753399 isoform X1 [Rhodamnia argentea]